MKSAHVNFINCNTVVELKDASYLKMIAGEIQNADLAFKLDENNAFPFTSEYATYKTITSDVNKMDNTK